MQARRHILIDYLNKYCHTEDHEVNHSDADEAVMKFLGSLGYQDVVDAWEQVNPKWYS